MNIRKKTILFFGSILCWLLARSKVRASAQHMQKLEFPTNTKDMGITMTDTVRQSWRHKWLKVKK
ncbi:MAG: hypothetical protein JXM68_02105 [Sedimentisphaerales bacterium]|nr:hypothetical protein [Sedimentisphaerales bacterium]